MKKIYTISRYNYLRLLWETCFTTDNEKLAKVKFRQFRFAFPYTNYILREEVVIVE